MKSIFSKTSFVITTMLLFTIIASAQDTTSVTTTVTDALTNEEAPWYMQPWVWVVGGIALLLLLIAAFSGGKRDKAKSRTDKVIITKTVRTETDVD